MTENNEYGRALRRRRERAGLEQQAVAKALGIHGSTLSRYEAGRMPPHPYAFISRHRVAIAILLNDQAWLRPA